MSRTVLFLCTGNYYRSRFAEILFNALASRNGTEWRAASRGLKIGWPGNVGAMSADTEARLTQLGIDFSEARRLPLECSECDLAGADMIVALKEDEHRPMLAEKFNGWQDRVIYWHVHDVDGAKPADALDEIDELVRHLLKQLK